MKDEIGLVFARRKQNEKESQDYLYKTLKKNKIIFEPNDFC